MNATPVGGAATSDPEDMASTRSRAARTGGAAVDDADPPSPVAAAGRRIVADAAAHDRPAVATTRPAEGWGP